MRKAPAAAASCASAGRRHARWPGTGSFLWTFSEAERANRPPLTDEDILIVDDEPTNLAPLERMRTLPDGSGRHFGPAVSAVFMQELRGIMTARERPAEPARNGRPA